MVPTAASQICDQFVRVCVMLVAAVVLLPYGLETAVAGAAFGAVPGALAGFSVIAFLYYRHKKTNKISETVTKQEETAGASGVSRLIPAKTLRVGHLAVSRVISSE